MGSSLCTAVVDMLVFMTAVKALIFSMGLTHALIF